MDIRFLRFLNANIQTTLQIFKNEINQYDIL